MDEVEEFLAHHGVKGMKWGVRRGRAVTASSKSKTPKSATNKTKSTNGGNLKYVGKELAFGSIGPVALIAGLGPPLSIALGVSVGVLRSPSAAKAIKETSKATASLIGELKDTKLSAMKKANL